MLICRIYGTCIVKIGEKKPYIFDGEEFKKILSKVYYPALKRKLKSALIIFFSFIYN
jgi:hypothetical protein